jgi:nucleoside-diphosphate-sugar epimerase
MRVFVTGGTGFIGSAIIQDLLRAGHKVLGLARSDSSAAALRAAGVEVHRGELVDTESLAAGARETDGVIHAGFIHDFANIAASGRTDLRAVEALGDALAGTGKPFVVTSGLAHFAPGRVTTERDAPNTSAGAAHRIPSEVATLALASRGVRATVINLPPTVHGDGDRAFVPALIATARAKGVSAYIGDGNNRWPAVHRLDTARLFRLALENGVAGTRYHGVQDEGVPTREIAAVIGRRLNLPVVSLAADEVSAHFGWLGAFFAFDCPASSAMTREQLGWTPLQAGLIEDLERGSYFSE